MAIGTKRIEDYVPVVKYNEGLYTELPMYIAGDLTVTGTTTIAGVSLTDLTVTGNTTIGNAATDTLGVTGVSTFTAGATTDAVNITGTAITTGKAIDIIDLAALTSGIGINVTSAATAITGAGRLVYSSHTGVTSTSGILNEFISAANDETVIVKVTASDVNALGTALQVSSATTTGNGITVAANALTDGFGISVTSSATASTATGRLLNVNHSGNASVSGVVAEVKSAAADETVVFQALASAALAAGKVANVSGAAVTTGTLLSVADANALTTGMVAQFKSNSSDATARTLVDIHNDHASAVGSIPLKITQDAPTSTNFKLMMTLGTMQIFVSDQTSPNTALTATEGSLCLNGSSTGQIFWNTDGATAWTALA